ncbi:hypothetical protein [Brucella sp. NBRC 12953]|uniref:hypothetical protein n=1 Tax=Brucella sp. NBRC 12953 TaxID=3075481 RepID=UPI00333EFFDB
MLRFNSQQDSALCKLAAGNTGDTRAHRLPTFRAAQYRSVILPRQHDPGLSMLAAEIGRPPARLWLSAAFAAGAAVQIADGRFHAAIPTKTKLRL